MQVEEIEINGFQIENFNQHDLDVGKSQGTCPLCSSSRKPENKKAKCASYDWERGLGTCHNCDKTFQIHTYKRKGKARTTKSEDYLLAHDLVKKAPRNISYQRLLWISVGKKIWGVSQFRLADEHIRLYVLNPTKYSQLKNLLIGNLDGSTMQ